MHLFTSRYLQRLPDILASQDIDLRIAAGETIALFYELGRNDNEVREPTCSTKSIEALSILSCMSEKRL